MTYAPGKITPFLWFDDKAEEAMALYTTLFPDSEIVSISRHEQGPMKGKVLTAVFRLAGRDFMALDGGPMFTFTEATSMFVNCDSQEEIDHLWDQLSDGGEIQQCGWLKDRYGLSWQIIPRRLGELLSDGDGEKPGRVMAAVLEMQKIDIAALEEAAATVP